MKLPRRSFEPRAPRRYRRAGRYASVTAAVLLALLVVLYVAARFYLPTLVARKVDIETLLSDVARQTVRFDHLEPFWDGLNPGIQATGVRVLAADGAPSVSVAQVQASVALLPLLWRQVELNRLVLTRPVFEAARSAEGRIGVVGLPPREAGAEAGGAWLLRQPRIIVHGAEVRWTDALEPNQPLTISKVEVRVRNSADRHRVVVSAQLPARVCLECSASFDIIGNPFAGAWDGEISLRTRGLNVGTLPLVLRERLPEQLRGQIDAQLWSDWREGRPQVVRGQASVRAFTFPLGVERPPLALREAAGDVTWYTRADGWRLDLIDTKFALIRRSWSPGRVRLTRSAGETAFQMERVELDDVSAFAAAHQSEHPLLARLVELRPSGALQHLDVRVRGPLGAPQRFAAQANALSLGIAPRERMPGMRGVSGRVSLTEDGGEIDLEANNFALDMPTVFRGPIEAQQASGRVRWRKTAEAWQVQATDLRVRAADGNGAGALSFELPHDRASSPVLQLRVDFRDGNGANAARYFPVHRLSPRTLAWMESSFIGGRIVAGHVIYEGAIRDFPFTSGKGRFEIRARARDASYRYLPGWLPITQAEAEVAVDGRDVRVTGRGRIGALQLRDVKVDINRPPEGAADPVVRVRGQLEGAVAETVRVLRDVDASRVYAWQTPLREIAQAEGSGALDLDLRLPLRELDKRSFLATYRFKGMALRHTEGMSVEAANGFVRVSEAGLRESSIHGQFLGGPLVIAAAHHDGELRVNASGRLRAAELLRGQRHLAERIDGDADWSLTWRELAGGPQLRAEADLRALRTRLPAPFAKSGASPPERLTITTRHSRPDAVTLAINAAPLVSGQLVFARGESWRFERGRLDVGHATERPVPARGLELSLGSDTLDVDSWLPLFAGGTRSSGPGFPYVTAFTADVRRLQLGHRQWGRLFAHVVRRDKEWRAVLDGDALAGEASLTLAPRTAPNVRLDLAYLRLPEAVDGETASELKKITDPRQLPKIDLHALSLEYRQRKYGELQFSATPYEAGWRIERANLLRPEMKFLARGAWRISAERQFTDINAEFESDDMGVSLEAFGIPEQMAGGKVRIKTNLSWPGSPMRPTLAGLDGKVEVTAEHGRFLKVKPGAARLFGLLDLRSIARYLTFDFTPAFGKGFVFDDINGVIAIENGNARTQNLTVKGPSLGLGVNGRVGLAAEDYDLVLEASPRLSTSLTLTSWGLLGPQAAAAVLAFQRLFRRQIEEGTRVTYIVKGSWDSPSITKLGKPPADDTNELPRLQP